ncbi:DUF3298 and DUF4163 domain-containing protein [Halalkalibacter alkalisediminis]|uniref:DUF3298 and DUF4163 domain-containing protein n=1 Tax=Halalkalibacter alkalisediminis TaxID=935616 RepID=A0ABV6NLQ8_9BACI|nr:DUF3298 and DUF4163 domain-containing protein [Halalkalibacter alkalisediminis]
MNTTQLPVDIISRQMIQPPRLDVYYPELAGLVDSHIQRRLNERVRKQVTTMIRKQTYNEQTTITGGFEIKNNQREVISLTNSHYSYSGGAHGITIQRSLTMNVRDGRIYTLRDLFKPNVNYQERLNELISKQIEERNLPILNEFQGITANQYFYIADKALVLYFQLYELVPYAWGFPYFVISLFDIQDLLLEDGALGRMSY